MPRGLSEEEWRRILDLSQSAAELPSHERLPFLESSGATPDVIREVLALVTEFVPASPEVDRVGTSIGRFQVTGRIGRGGMGDVYSARDTDLGRTVALKFLTPEALGVHGAMDRFIREARTASALNHRNIVTVHEVLRSETTVALVMEFVEGASLRQFCGKPLPIGQVLQIGQQIAQALAAAHAEGIVHRDIKPENVIVQRDGSLKVLDFGLARWVAPDERTGNWNSTVGLPAGTWRYMSPEQARGESVTGASDVFSLGLILYELCAGRHPFPADSPIETAQAIASRQPPPPSEFNLVTPEPLDTLILAMLSKNPSARPASETVARTLEQFQRPGGLSPTTLRRNRRSWRKRWPWAVASVLLLGGGALYWWLRTGEPQIEFSQLTTLVSENRATAASLSPDGRLLAYANVDGIFVRGRQSGETNSLNAPSDFVVDHLAWFYDGTRLLASGFSAATNVSAIWSVSVTGGTPRLMRIDARLAVPSPDGTRIAFLSRDQSAIWVMGASGEQPRQIVTGPPGDTFPLVFWSANGLRLSFQRRHYSGKQDLGLAMLDRYYERSYESVALETGRTVAHVPDLWINSATALPDGRLLFLRWDPPGSDYSNELWEARTDPATGAFRGPLRKIASPIASTGPGDHIYDMSATSDGNQVVVLRRSDQNAVFLGDFNQTEPHITGARRLVLDEGSNFPHAWTADSRAVIFESGRNGNEDIYKQRVDRRTADLIVGTPLREVLPQLSPDGRWILYVAIPPGARPGNFRLMRVSADGGTPEEIPVGGGLDEFRCSVRPEGRCVLRANIDRRFYAYYDLDPLRGKGRELAHTAWIPEVVADWDISPDGGLVAIPNHDSRSARIRVIPLDEGKTSRREAEIDLPGLTDLSGLTWSANGEGWFVVVETPLGNRAIFVSMDGQWRGIGDIQGWVVPSHDGQQVAFVNPTTATNVWIIKLH